MLKTSFVLILIIIVIIKADGDCNCRCALLESSTNLHESMDPITYAHNRANSYASFRRSAISFDYTEGEWNGDSRPVTVIIQMSSANITDFCCEPYLPYFFNCEEINRGCYYPPEPECNTICYDVGIVNDDIIVVAWEQICDDGSGYGPYYDQVEGGCFGGNMGWENPEEIISGNGNTELVYIDGVPEMIIDYVNDDYEIHDGSNDNVPNRVIDGMPPHYKEELYDDQYENTPDSIYNDQTELDPLNNENLQYEMFNKLREDIQREHSLDREELRKQTTRLQDIRNFLARSLSGIAGNIGKLVSGTGAPPIESDDITESDYKTGLKDDIDFSEFDKTVNYDSILQHYQQLDENHEPDTSKLIGYFDSSTFAPIIDPFRVQIDVYDGGCNPEWFVLDLPESFGGRIPVDICVYEIDKYTRPAFKVLAVFIILMLYKKQIISLFTNATD